MFSRSQGQGLAASAEFKSAFQRKAGMNRCSELVIEGPEADVSRLSQIDGTALKHSSHEGCGELIWAAALVLAAIPIAVVAFTLGLGARVPNNALLSMRKAVKFFHTLASCGLIGALLGYGIVLQFATQNTARTYADARQIISALCNYLLLPSLAIALITGLLSMAVHPPFQDKRWAWVKAFLGLSMFEATLGIIQSKANYAATISVKIAAARDVGRRASKRNRE